MFHLRFLPPSTRQNICLFVVTLRRKFTSPAIETGLILGFFEVFWGRATFSLLCISQHALIPLMKLKTVTMDDATERLKANTRLDLSYLPPVDSGPESSLPAGLDATSAWLLAHGELALEYPDDTLELHKYRAAASLRKAALNRLWLTCPGFAIPRRDHQQVLAVHRGKMHVFQYPYAMNMDAVVTCDIDCQPQQRLKRSTLFAHGLTTVCQNHAKYSEFMQWAPLDEAGYRLSTTTRKRRAAAGTGSGEEVPESTVEWLVLNLYQWYLWCALALSGGFDNTALFAGLDPRDRAFWLRNDQGLQNAYRRRVVRGWAKSGTDKVEAQLSFFRRRRDRYLLDWEVSYAHPARRDHVVKAVWELTRYGSIPLPQSELDFSLAAHFVSKNRYDDDLDRLQRLQAPTDAGLTLLDRPPPEPEEAPAALAAQH